MKKKNIRIENIVGIFAIMLLTSIFIMTVSAQSSSIPIKLELTAEPSTIKVDENSSITVRLLDENDKPVMSAVDVPVDLSTNRGYVPSSMIIPAGKNLSKTKFTSKDSGIAIISAKSKGLISDTTSIATRRPGITLTFGQDQIGMVTRGTLINFFWNITWDPPYSLAGEPYFLEIKGPTNERRYYTEFKIPLESCSNFAKNDSWVVPDDEPKGSHTSYLRFKSVGSSIMFKVVETLLTIQKLDDKDKRLQGWEFKVTDPGGYIKTYFTNYRGEIGIEVPEEYAGESYTIEEILPSGWSELSPIKQTVKVSKGKTTTVKFLNKKSLTTPTPSYQESVDKALEGLPMGRIFFNPPKEMKVGETELVEVRITQNITENLTKCLEGHGEPEIKKTQVSQYLSVQLTGANFDIKPQNGKRKIIESNKSTEWQFYITPLKTGIQRLKLTYFVIIPVQGAERQKEYEVGVWEVSVKVTPMGQLKCYWQFIVTTLIAILALIISIIAIQKKKRREER